MSKIGYYFDGWSLLIIVMTFALFVAALYFTGITHDLLLESGVFLVSVKLILMSYKNKVASDNLHTDLAEIRSLIQEMNRELKRDDPKIARVFPDIIGAKAPNAGVKAERPSI